MAGTETTVAIQRYLADLREADGEAAADPIIRALVARSVGRLQTLAARILYGGFPRLARGPLGIESGDMLGAVAERMIKALREARPKDVRQFYALAGQHLRWELLDLARQVDAQGPAAPADEALLAAPESSDGGLSAEARRILEVIDRLPDEEGEVFTLLRLQELTPTEAAEVLGVSTKTVQRRLARALVRLADELGDPARAT